MKRKKIVIDRFTPFGNGMSIDPKGIKIKGEIPFTLDHDHHKPLFKSNVKTNSKEIYFLHEEKLLNKYKDLYPSIGIRIIKSEHGESGEVITECELLWVGLCAGFNLDPNIKTIGEQLKSQKQ